MVLKSKLSTPGQIELCLLIVRSHYENAAGAQAHGVSEPIERVEDVFYLSAKPSPDLGEKLLSVSRDFVVQQRDEYAKRFGLTDRWGAKLRSEAIAFFEPLRVPEYEITIDESGNAIYERSQRRIQSPDELAQRLLQ